MTSTRPSWWPTIEKLCRKAAERPLGTLLEHETYELLTAMGCQVPAHVFVPHGSDPALADYSLLTGDQVVLKVAHPAILHKSDMAGVMVVPNEPGAIAAGVARIESNTAGVARIEANTDDRRGADDPSHGVLACHKVDYPATLGSELIVSLRISPALGPVLYFGLGGVDTELMGAAIPKPLAIVSAHGQDEASLRQMLRSHWVYPKLAGYRGQAALVDEALLLEVLLALTRLGNAVHAYGREAGFSLSELEINPLALTASGPMPLDAVLHAGPAGAEPAPARPLDQIDALLKPKRLAVVGVSKRKNLGRIILRNILRNGITPGQVTVLKHGLAEIDGCRCVPTLEDLDEPVDLLVVAVEASRVPDIVATVEASGKARGVLLISSGLGEKSGTEHLAARVTQCIKDSRAAGRGASDNGARTTDNGFGALYNGGNSLGIISRPASLDTMFNPPAKLPPNDSPLDNVALISQSGAFMITRMSKQGTLRPRYAISLGNQIDLTLSDYLHWLVEHDPVQVLACYVEGFKDHDGLRFLDGVRKARAAGRDVVVYKAGRTAAGQASSASHSASIAGDYDTAVALLKQAGAWVCQSIGEFEDALTMLSFFNGKRPTGRRIAAISNAGFESVAMGDNASGIELVDYAPATKDKLKAALSRAKINALVDVRNPLDVTPMADDSIWEDCVRAMIEDPATDAALISIVPLTPAMQTLPPGDSHHDDCNSDQALPARLKPWLAKASLPILVTIDSGTLYDPYVRLFQEAGVPVLREADRGMRVMNHYLRYACPQVCLSLTQTGNRVHAAQQI